MTIAVGDTVPDTGFSIMTTQGPEGLSSEDLFKGKTVALFGVPGAFTPTCSAKHVPGFLANAEAFKAKGVDTIACVSVNDPFVMGAWGKDQNVGDTITMLADGSANFAKAAGIELDLTERGLGMRCCRFSAIIENGVVKILNLEEGGAFEVSSAEDLLAAL